MKKLIVCLIVLFSTQALAQQQTPIEQALSNKLLQEIQSGIACSSSVISLRAELTKAQERIKELEVKEKK